MDREEACDPNSDVGLVGRVVLYLVEGGYQECVGIFWDVVGLFQQLLTVERLG